MSSPPQHSATALAKRAKGSDQCPRSRLDAIGTNHRWNLAIQLPVPLETHRRRQANLARQTRCAPLQFRPSPRHNQLPSPDAECLSPAPPTSLRGTTPRHGCLVDIYAPSDMAKDVSQRIPLPSAEGLRLINANLCALAVLVMCRWRGFGDLSLDHRWSAITLKQRC